MRAEIDSGCPAGTYPVQLRLPTTTNGSSDVALACSVYSPQQRDLKSSNEISVKDSLVASKLMPSPVLWVAYDPLANGGTGKFDIALARNLTSSELSQITGLVPGDFNVQILDIHLAQGVCDTFTNPPDGVCDTLHNGGGSLGFRAKQYVCAPSCYWLYGGTTFSHGSVAVGDILYQPDTTRSYGVVNTAVCANGVDASFFRLGFAQSEMDNSMLQGGPVFGDYTSGFVSGILLKHIGRGSVNLGTFVLFSAEVANTCGSNGTDWFAKWYSGSQTTEGDSGSGVGVGATVNGVSGALRAGIEWGVTTRDGVNTIIMTPWSDVTNALGIQGY